ncbi:phage tail tape measure protein [Nocardioides alkalitolerans]|uniref:phage tail tape measure protein n=1 Tax=Nocardioides alkalitolerans TaxID=281714 RepID=UPI0003FBF9EA|nr:phage tail tape measure protein [Nocardioides alkalitolerans]
MGLLQNLVIGIGLDPAGIEEGASEGEGMLRSAAAKFAVAGAAIGAATVAGIVGAMNIEAANDKLAGQLGLTEAQSARAGSAAGAVYAGAYGESMEEVNTAIGSVMSSIAGMRDASTADLEAMTEKALNFATAFEVDVARGTEVAGQLITNGLAKDATEAFDLLVAGLQAVPIAAQEGVIDAASEYGTFFKQAGIDGQAMFELLALGAQQGEIGIDKTGDAIGEFTKLITGDMARTEPVIEGLGLNYGEMANALVAGGDQAASATSAIVDGLLGIEDPAAQTRAALELFGTPLEDLGTDKIPAFLNALSGGSGALDDFTGAADRLDEGLGGNASAALTSFKRQVEVAFVNFVGGKALPIVTTMAQFLAEEFGPTLSAVAGFMRDDLMPAAETFFGFLSEHQTTVTVIAGLIGGVLGTALTVWAVRSVASAATNTIAWFTTATASTASATVQSRSAMQVVVGWLWMGTQSLIAGARVAAAWVVAMGPIGWAIAAVVGLVALVIWKWDEIKAATGKVWDWFSAKITAVWNAVTGWIGRKVGEVVGFVARVGAVPGMVGGYFGDMKDRAISKGAELVAWVAGMPGSIVSGVGDLGGLLLDAGADIVRGLWDGISGMGDWIVGKLGDFVSDVIPGPIKDVLGIASPSKVTAELGRWTGRGLADGLLDTAGDVTAASSALAAAAVPELASVGAYDMPTARVDGMRSIDGGGPGGTSSGGFTDEQIERIVAGFREALEDLDIESPVYVGARDAGRILQVGQTELEASE